MNTPLVSIVIPTYNRSYLIGETLDSILAQTYTNWECIVIDDGSTDNTVKLLSEYCKKDNRFQYHQRPNDRPKGANSCRNYGFEISRGTYINWFDSDDIMKPNFISINLNVLRGNNYNASICRLKVFKNDRFLYDSKMDLNQKSENVLKSYVSGNLNMGLPTVVFSRDSVKGIKFDESLVRAQELKFFFDIFSMQKLNVILIHEFLVLIRRHENSITTDFEMGKLQSLISELNVRGEALYYARLNNWEKEFFDKSLILYLFPLFKLIKNYSTIYVFKQMRLLSLIFVNYNGWKKWKIKFFLLLLIYKLTGRDHQLNSHFKILKTIK